MSSGLWDEDGNLRLPAWIERAGPMPPTWPVFWFWAMVGKAELDSHNRLHVKLEA